MKKILLLLLFLCPIAASAQDVIVKKDGSTIVSKVIEITSTEVKYKKASNLNGPTYTIAKTELQAINYENGEKEMFTETTDYSVPAKVIGQQEVSDAALLRMAGNQPDYEKKAKRLKIVGWTVGGLFFSAGVALGATGISWEFEDGGAAFAGAGAGLCVVGIATTIACLVRANKLSKQSLYSVSTAPLYQQDIHFNNGSSLTAGVDLLKDAHINHQTVGLGLRYNF